MSTEAGKHGRYLAGRLGNALVRLGNGPERPLAHLEGLYHVRSMLDYVEGALITAARESGHSYAEIGRVLGVSRQAVRQAHARRSVPAGDFDRWLDRKQRESASSERDRHLRAVR